jgi:hypothetical protein
MKTWSFFESPEPHPATIKIRARAASLILVKGLRDRRCAMPLDYTNVRLL